MRAAFCDQCRARRASVQAIAAAVIYRYNADATAGDEIFRMDLCGEHVPEIQQALMNLQMQDVVIPMPEVVGGEEKAAEKQTETGDTGKAKDAKKARPGGS